MAKVPARMRGALDRKIAILAKQKRLKGKNLQRVTVRSDRLRGPTSTTTTTRKPTTTTTTLPKRKPQGKADLELIKQGFTAKEIGIPKSKKK